MQIRVHLWCRLGARRSKYLYLYYKNNKVTTGQSQYSCLGENGSEYMVWNMPFEIGFRTKNPYGWPQLVITLVCPDFLGREVIKGYGMVHVPTQPGR